MASLAPASGSATGLRVLITNNTLDSRAGTELYVRDLALALARAGHQPMAVSSHLGPVADEIRSAGIGVYESADAVPSRPDIIHGHHHLDTMAALLSHPEVPVIYTCHGVAPWQERPPRHPSIQCYVAVDHVTQQHVADAVGIDATEVRIIPNFVDLERFPARVAAPPSGRLLILSNTATEDNFAAIIAGQAEDLGWQVSVRGNDVGEPVDDPAALMKQFDAVVAKGRTALEAAAVGCAVLVADQRGTAGWVTPDNFDELRARNFGFTTMTTPVTPEGIRELLTGYSPAHTAAIQARVRSEADLTDTVAVWLDLYRQALAQAQVPDPQLARAATARYLVDVAVDLKKLALQGREHASLTGRLAAAAEQLRFVSADNDALRSERAVLAAQVRQLEEALAVERSLPLHHRIRRSLARRVKRRP